MRFLIVGEWSASIYEEAIAASLDSLGHTTQKFSWVEHFQYAHCAQRFNRKVGLLKSLYFKFQYKFSFGPAIRKLNFDLLDAARNSCVDVIFINRGVHILPLTLHRLRLEGYVLLGHNNDDPFSPGYPSYFWRHFLKAIPFYDHIFAYRKHNITEYLDAGAREVSLLRSYYIKEQNFYIKNRLENPANESDVRFIGHYENDGRDKTLLSLHNKNFRTSVSGTGWEKSNLYSKLVEAFGLIRPEYADYNLKLNATKIALVFLSKLNRDTYTRRCFEIPATRTFMLAEYSEDLASLFKEGEEVEFFRSKEELHDKIDFYLKNEAARLRIAEAGYRRLILDGHEVTDRARVIANIALTSIINRVNTKGFL